MTDPYNGRPPAAWSSRDTAGKAPSALLEVAAAFVYIFRPTCQGIAMEQGTEAADHLAGLAAGAQRYKAILDSARAEIGDGIRWYPYGSLDNFHILDLTLQGGDRTVFADAQDQSVVDIGAADGETSLFLASQGHLVDVVDYGPTNLNGCRGVRALNAHLAAGMGVHEMDLDAQFRLPREHYALCLLLGILYHLKNPYYVLETLARHCRTVLLSTRIARYDRPAGSEGALHLDRAPLAYLLAPDECNGDATNYWIFTEPGLRRLLDRCGWDVGSFRTFGAVGASDPATPQGDERAFCLARSRHFA